jgi:hypothetical protein
VKPFTDISGEVKWGLKKLIPKVKVTENEIWFSYSDDTNRKNAAAGFRISIEVHREEVRVRRSLSSCWVDISDYSFSSRTELLLFYISLTNVQ